MKIFIFSRRFLIVFFSLLLLAGAYFFWEMRDLYYDDFKGKGLPSSVMTGWLLNNIAGRTLSLMILLSLLAGMSYYSHYASKRYGSAYKPFSVLNITVVMAIALVLFLFVSFSAPSFTQRSLVTVSNMVFARTAEEFYKAQKDTTPVTKTESIMTLPELIKEKKEGGRPIKKLSYEIGKRIALPFSVILNYILGVLLGISFRRLPGIVPLLLSYFVLFAIIYYTDQYFRTQYNKDNIGSFLAANGTTIIFGMLAVVWYFILRRYNKPKPEFTEGHYK